MEVNGQLNAHGALLWRKSSSTHQVWHGVSGIYVSGLRSNLIGNEEPYVFTPLGILSCLCYPKCKHLNIIYLCCNDICINYTD
jgi:hypothetical protein